MDQPSTSRTVLCTLPPQASAEGHVSLDFAAAVLALVFLIEAAADTH
ncbi:hypothetical protein MW290_13550 [Aquincola tertiaricarbonis]|uniref:Uncharacterized protein n=1 Tax=Aquincola tertiaricarbonis TaxID=391953 RepID=A0ABY4S1V9_AQUTE|nr:hypothetical protein [Aquincola tertiaricarbonis]URI06913.1 hypothetical protein MW290_13550 [Aquincola tertiaricarbonis]